jgi:hypothetical protein
VYVGENMQKRKRKNKEILKEKIRNDNGKYEVKGKSAQEKLMSAFRRQ